MLKTFTATIQAINPQTGRKEPRYKETFCAKTQANADSLAVALRKGMNDQVLSVVEQAV